MLLSVPNCHCRYIFPDVAVTPMHLSRCCFQYLTITAAATDPGKWDSDGIQAHGLPSVVWSSDHEAMVTGKSGNHLLTSSQSHTSVHTSSTWNIWGHAQSHTCMHTLTPIVINICRCTLTNLQVYFQYLTYLQTCSQSHTDVHISIIWDIYRQVHTHLVDTSLPDISADRYT